MDFSLGSISWFSKRGLLGALSRTQIESRVVAYRRSAIQADRSSGVARLTVKSCRRAGSAAAVAIPHLHLHLLLHQHDQHTTTPTPRAPTLSLPPVSHSPSLPPQPLHPPPPPPHPIPGSPITRVFYAPHQNNPITRLRLLTRKTRPSFMDIEREKEKLDH
ncbi:hypothetical protein M0802_012635 [Mischocyttarus mexicanus]|nr:hypothetical protein M0802_012641 [Mischocyttarus mexicanus]KAI4485653.1 hypothetical protein M0802_012635 [Mischocyttarus mexicanus]